MTGTVTVRLADLDAAERRLLREIRRTWDTVLSLSMRRERYECQPRPDDAALWLARIDETFRAQRVIVHALPAPQLSLLSPIP